MKPVLIEEEIKQALAHHQAGRLMEAEAIYRQVLAGQPNHPGRCMGWGRWRLKSGKERWPSR